MLLLGIDVRRKFRQLAVWPGVMGNTSDRAGCFVELTETYRFRGDVSFVRKLPRWCDRADGVLPVTLDHRLPQSRAVLAVERAGKSAMSMW